MELRQKGVLFLQNRELIVDAIDQISSWLSRLYGSLPTLLPRRTDFQWFKDFKFNVSSEFIQLYRTSWPNKLWNGVHLEIAHSRDTILEARLHLQLHVESQIRQNHELWPQLGTLILEQLSGASIGLGGYVERQLQGHSSLARAEIPLQASEMDLTKNICDALYEFKPAVEAVDDALKQCIHAEDSLS